MTTHSKQSTSTVLFTAITKHKTGGLSLYTHSNKAPQVYLALHTQKNVTQAVAFNKAPQTIIPHTHWKQSTTGDDSLNTHSKQSTTGDNSLYTYSKQGTTDGTLLYTFKTMYHWQQGLTKHHRLYVKLCWYFFIQAFMLKWVISKYKIHMTIIWYCNPS